MVVARPKFAGPRLSQPAESGFKHLRVLLEAVHPIHELLEVSGHGAEQIPRAGLLEMVGSGLVLLHRAPPGQEPITRKPQGRCQCCHKLNTGGLPLHVAAHGFRVRLRELAHVPVRPVANRGIQPVMQPV